MASLPDMCIWSSTAALQLQDAQQHRDLLRICSKHYAIGHICPGPEDRVMGVQGSTHLLGGLALGCAGEGAHSHNVLRLRVQTLLRPQIEAAEKCFYRALGHRGHPGHPLPYLLWGACTTSSNQGLGARQRHTHTHTHTHTPETDYLGNLHIAVIA